MTLQHFGSSRPRRFRALSVPAVLFTMASAGFAAAPDSAAKAAQEEEGITRLDLFVSGTEGYTAFRIPAMIQTRNGDILVICEARKKSFSDQGDIDLVSKRSRDGGKTWGPLKLVYDDGENTAGNPCPVVDRKTGKIILPFCRNNKEVFVMTSTDHGETWSKPVNITSSVIEPRWTWYATGPGHGLQLASGRILIPCDHKLDHATKQQPELYFSHVIYSDDLGETWKLGGTPGERTNECQAIETEDGLIHLNMRSYHDKNRRAISWSKDGGVTFTKPELDETLIEPKCQASLLRYSSAKDGKKNRVLFSNPASTERKNMTVRLSYDECRTWPVSKVLNPGKSVYSELAAAPDGAILCLYENGEKNQYEKMTLARFTLAWLTDGKDTGD